MRFAVIILSVPATLIGGTVLVNSSRHIRHDIAMVVADLKREERDAALMAADPDHIPALAVAGVDFSYGPVQVLFDVNFHVERGETLALLGTNGAGKSTVFNVIITVGRGEVVGLIGTNGAGKSTLVNAIGGYVPSRGRIELEGTDNQRPQRCGPGPCRSGSHLPGRRALPGTDRSRDGHGRLGGEGADRVRVQCAGPASIAQA